MKDLNKIKLIVLDCDGVLTDGHIIYDNNQIESKNFSTHDGLGAKILSYSGIQIAVVTGRKSKVLEKRCADLSIKLLYQDIQNKQNCIEVMLEELELEWQNVAYMGDDWNDWPAMQMSGFKTAPENAQEDIKKQVDWVSTLKGGDGAVRELINFILKEQGIYEKCIHDFLDNLPQSNGAIN